MATASSISSRYAAASAAAPYATGDSAFVLANPTPAGSMFERGQTTAALRDTFAVPTCLAMPARAVTLSPVYRAAPTWTPVF